MNQDPLREGDGIDVEMRRATTRMVADAVAAVALMYGGDMDAMDTAAGCALSVGTATLVGLYGKAAAKKEIEDFVARLFANERMFPGARP